MNLISISQFSSRELVLLSSAADDGRFTVMNAPSTGEFVETANQRFTFNDPVETIRYLESFKRLYERGFVVRLSSWMFRLTSEGFDVARSIRASLESKLATVP